MGNRPPFPSGGCALVVGLGIAGSTTARHLRGRKWEVTVIEDNPSQASRTRFKALEAPGIKMIDIKMIERPSESTVRDLVEACDLVVPSPGVAASHRSIVLAQALEKKVCSEFELAAHWSEIPVVAITGTNGKTTVTTLIDEMFKASGLRSIAAGNTDLPLIAAVDEVILGPVDLDVVVVEASSFRLAFTESFHPKVGVWLNVAEDHLDWHETMESYIEAKSKIWANQTHEDVAIACADDPLVMEAASKVHSTLITFGHDKGDWRVDGSRLRMPDGSTLIEIDELWRKLPHDLTNVMAASAAALAGGATMEGVLDALHSFRGLPHRVSLVGQHRGIDYYDDSKATDPHATLAAIRSFDSVVLIAGGRNKGLDLSVLSSESRHLRAVVAIGEAAGEIIEIFNGKVPVKSAHTMREAVVLASDFAQQGDSVLLSPGCASFDWYSSYGERGDDFARCFGELS